MMPRARSYSSLRYHRGRLPLRPRAAKCPSCRRRPVHRARWKRARHRKYRVVVLRNLVNLVSMLAVLAFIALMYRALTIYAAQRGYTHVDARLGIALFLAGGLVGALVCYSWLAGRRR
jgi:hypothetical protein